MERVQDLTDWDTPPDPRSRRPLGRSHSTSPSQATTPRVQSATPCVPSMTPPMKSATPCVTSTTTPMKTLDPTVGVGDPSGAVYDPGVEDPDLTAGGNDFSRAVQCLHDRRISPHGSGPRTRSMDNLTSSPGSATLSLRSADSFAGIVDCTRGVRDCRREVGDATPEVVVAGREADPSHGGGAPSPAERSATLSVPSMSSAEKSPQSPERSATI
jgi:hypothetical protein